MCETKTILLAEDDPHDVELVEREFKQAPAGINLQVARDGVEAMHYVAGEEKYADRAKHPLPDVILLDIKMPRMDGFDFLLWLRSRAPTQQQWIPVVIMSSSGLPEDVEHAYLLGANSYIIKPVNWHVFRERIKALGIHWAAQGEAPQNSRNSLESWERSERERTRAHELAW